MTQEFALAFAFVSFVYGARYMTGHRTHDLWLAGAAMFMALTSHTMTILPLAIGYAMILLVGLIGAVTFERFRRPGRLTRRPFSTHCCGTSYLLHLGLNDGRMPAQRNSSGWS
jgi:uncharacterized membrane protein